MEPMDPTGDEFEDWAVALAALDRPVELLVFVSQACPYCTKAVEYASRVAALSPHISLEVVDAQADAARAESFDVHSVPLIVIDRELRTSGVLSPDELSTWILERGTASHDARLLVSMLEEGHIEDAPDRILAPGGGDAFARAWQGSAMSLRMGLMAALEDVLDQDPHALDAAVPRLAQSLGSEDATLRGDTADLLGRIGHPSAVVALAAIADDPNPDVAEAVADALLQLREA